MSVGVHKKKMGNWCGCGCGGEEVDLFPPVHLIEREGTVRRGREEEKRRRRERERKTKTETGK